MSKPIQISGDFENRDLIDRSSNNFDKDKLNRTLFILLFFVGLINNTGYVLVMAASQALATQFGESDLMAAFNLCLIVFTILVVLGNSSLLINVKHKTRILINLLLSALAYVIIGVSSMTDHTWGFYVSLIGAILIGVAQCLGETTILGYLKAFPSEVVSGWSSGTGCAGIFGTLVFLGLSALNVKFLYIFLAMIPTLVIYFFIFKVVEQKLKIYNESQVTLLSQDNYEIQNMNLSWENIKLVFPKVRFLVINLALVYYAEYVCLSSFADRANQAKNDKDKDFFHENAYAILSFCYQLGVFASRSSLSIIKIKKVWILTTIQYVNFGIWLAIAIIQNVNIWLQFVLMIWVGLMGGCSYVNVAYQIYEDPNVEKHEKELAMNVEVICNNGGVTLAAASSLIISTFLIK